MAICSDKSVKHLQKFGYNVVLHPKAAIAPLQLIGEVSGRRDIIGTVDQLLGGSAAKPPPIAAGGDAANISGKSTSKLDLSLGLDILGEIIGALGGTKVGVTGAYNKAKTIEFTYDDVSSDTVNIVALGDFLVSGTPKWDHPIFKQYFGKGGHLYVITEVVRSDKFGVTAYDKNGVAIGVDVPVIKAAVGASVKVGVENETTRKVNYEGKGKLAFGFKAFALSRGKDAQDKPVLLVAPVAPGGIAVSSVKANKSKGAPEPVIFDGAIILHGAE